MYQDGTITTEFTGYYDSDLDEYVYPSARQNLMLFNGIGDDYALTAPPVYLSAADGDFTADGVTFTYSVGANEDIAIGQSLSATMSGTILNENGYLDDFSFSELCQAWIGVVTSETDVTIPNGASCYIVSGDDNDIYYSIGDEGYKNGTALGFAGGADIVSIVSRPTEEGTAPDEPTFYLSDNTIWYYLSPEEAVPPLTPGWKHSAVLSNFVVDKYTRTPQSISLSAYNSLGPIGVATWDVESGKQLTWTYIPMGIFDMSSVSIHGVAYTFEVYDRMTSFDAPATEWIESLDFTTPKTISGLLQELMEHLGYYEPVLGFAYYTIDSDAVNTSVTISENPFTNLSSTYRQIMQWIAEAIGCNVRMGRNGYVEFFNYGGQQGTPPWAAGITPHTIVNQSRYESRYEIPKVTSVTLYGTDGTYYTSGTPGTDYYIMGNPLLDPLNTTAVDEILRIFHITINYHANTLTDACADPRLDAGDLLAAEWLSGAISLFPIMHQTVTWRGNTVAEYSATGSQKREAPSEADRSEYEAAVTANKQRRYVLREGDTMTGDLENTAVNTRRTVMQGNRFYAENTGDTTQNASHFYNGFTATNGTNTATLTPTGLNLDGTILTSAIGTQLRSNGTTSVPSATWTATGSFTLAKGTWVIIAYTQFPNNTTGVRGMNLHQTAGSSSGQTSEYADCGNAVGGTFVSRLRVVVPRTVGSTTTFYINAFQSSGAAQTVTWVYNCVRIK